MIKKETKDIIIGAKVTKTKKEAFGVYCKAYGVTMSNAINQLIDAALSEYEAQQAETKKGKPKKKP